MVYSRGWLRAPKHDSHGSGACALRLASERRPGRADGVALTRARSSRRNDMDDVHQRRTRPGTGQGATMPGVPSSPQHFRDERLAGKQTSPRKTRKARAQFLPTQPPRSARVLHRSSCWCAQQQPTKPTTARAKHRYKTKQPCRFWRQAKIISYRYDWHAARKTRCYTHSTSS